MKPVLLLLAGSLATNAILVGAFLMRTTVRRETISTEATVPEPTRIVPGAPGSISATDGWRALHYSDLATFAANLRSAGLAEHLVRAAIAAEIDERFRAREEALAPPRPPLKYWQFDTHRDSLETRLALLDLKREKARLRLALIGPDAPEFDDGGTIPPTKREIAQMITEDYDTVIKDLRQKTGRMPLPAEAAMMKSLEEDKRRELATYLTPEELAEYEMRTSGAFQMLRQQLAVFAPTEGEFLSIYATQDEMQQWLNHAYSRAMDDFENSDAYITYMSREKADQEKMEQSLMERLRSDLGEERFRAYRRERDSHLQDVRSLVDRAGLPRESAEQLYDLRSTAASKSARIGNDFAMSLDARKAALREIAANFRTQAQTMLGPEAGNAYVQSANGWLRLLEQGSTVEFRDNGWGASMISATPPVARP